MPSLPFALEQLAYILLYRKQYQEARDAAEEAVQLNPNYADGYAVWAHALIYGETRRSASQNARSH